MGKKDTKKKDEQVSSKRVSLIKKYIDIGNFFNARKLARTVLSSEDKTDNEIAVAKEALRITKPDPLVILAGFICLIFSVGSAFLAAY